MGRGRHLPSAAAGGPPEPTSGTDPEEEERPESWSDQARRRLRIVVHSVRTNVPLEAGLVLLGLFGAVGVFAVLHFSGHLDTLTGNQAYAQSIFPPGPSAGHLLGVMRGNGVDVLSGLVQATPWDLALVGGPVLLAMTVGVFLGAYAGFASDWSDLLVTTGGDLLVGIPPFFLVIVLFIGVQPLLAPSAWLLAFGLLFAFVLWPYYARPVRAQAQHIRAEPYIDAARAAGARTPRLIVRHVLPNSFFPALAQIPIDVYNIFFVLTVFPFISCFTRSGSGSGPYQLLSPLPSTSFPEWGSLLSTGACYGWSVLPVLNFWWMYLFPAATILLFGIAVTLTCDGMRRFLTSGRVA